jgi:pyruvate/2-oxoglutarate dehydrogenase complex dihydrolipoamide acyltransferase (E2) component
MAESISEGTLKQWAKSVGDYVEADEEIATIETDKVREILATASVEDCSNREYRLT